MVQRIILLIFTLGVIPVALLSGFYLYRLDRTNEAQKRAEINKELEYASINISEFLKERITNLRVISQVSVATVALDFKRPEGLSRFLNMFIAQSKAFERIVVLDKEMQFFAIGEDPENPSLELDDLLLKMNNYKKMLVDLGEKSEQFFYVKSQSTSEAYLVSRIRDSYETTIGYYVAQINLKVLNRYIDVLRSRLGRDQIKNFSVDFTWETNPRVVSAQTNVLWCKKVAPDESIGQLCLEIPQNELSMNVLYILGIFVAGLFLLLIVFAYLSSQLVKFVMGPFQRFLKEFSALATGQKANFEVKSNIPEIRIMETNALQLTQRLNDYREAFEKSAIEAAKGKIATQVAHDIRSPLLALKMAMMMQQKKDSTSREENRVLMQTAIQRIQDIASDLLNKNKTPLQTLENESLYSILKTIVSEKRLLIEDMPDLSIEFVRGPNAYDAYAAIQPIEMKRLLSNIINNSLDALNQRGQIRVVLNSDKDNCVICIEDNGKGIPDEMLTKVTDRGVTFGKMGGNGLGLYHAKTTLEGWNGKLQISSKVGTGTAVNITLPKVSAPPWSTNELVLPLYGNIVVLDDDSSVHKAWESRLAPFLEQNQINLYHYYNTSDLLADEGKISNQGKIYLVDNELLNDSLTGIEFIRQYRLAQRAVLVTNTFEDVEVRKKCAQEKIKLLPKINVSDVPIRVEKL